MFVAPLIFLALQDRTPSLTGNIERLSAFRSEALNNERDILVYLPPQYKSEPKRRFAVMYLNDGQNVFDGATSFIPNQEWKADEAAQSLIEAQLIEPIILVAIPNMGSERANEYLPTRRTFQGTAIGGRADKYLHFLSKELKPHIDQQFRTKADRTNTALCGSSFGGIATLYIGLSAPDTFGKLGVVSPSVWWDDRAILKTVASFKGPRPHVWIDMGTKEGDESLSNARLLRDELLRVGWVSGKNLAYFEDGFAGHNESAWARRFPFILQNFFGRPR